MPTVARPSLTAAVESVAPQLSSADELIVVGDGWQPAARRVCKRANRETVGHVVYMEATWSLSRFGNHQRDVGLQLATGTHICFLDDDDVYRPDALEAFRAATAGRPNAVHVFRAEWGSGHHAHGTILWREPVFEAGNVATCMVLYPRAKAMPRWMEFNEAGIVSDFGWMQAAAQSRVIRWHPEIVATVRPEAR